MEPDIYFIKTRHWVYKYKQSRTTLDLTTLSLSKLDI